MDILASSKNPNEVSLTVKATLLGLVPVVLGVVRLLGVDAINEDWLKSFIDVVAQAAMAITTLLSVGGILWGLLRKLWNKPST